MPELATFYGDVYRRSRLTSQQTTLYWRQLQDNLRFLYERAVICDALHSRLHTQAQAVMPERLRIGFDYADPIGANLVQRTDNASICAVDVKNLRVDSLVGLGLAKASHRWLSPARRPALFDHLQRLQLGDIREAFPFLVFYETTQRICRRMDQGERLLKRVRSNDTKRAALVRLLDSYNGLAPITVQQPHATVDGA